MSLKQPIHQFVCRVGRHAGDREISARHAPTRKRPEVIWTDQGIAAFACKADELELSPVADGLRLASRTGLRKDELISLTWHDIGATTIVKRERKSGRHYEVPILPALRALLDELKQRPRRAGVDTVLVNRVGQRWTSASFGAAFYRTCVALVPRPDENQSAEAAKRRILSARATFCANLVAETALTDDEISSMVRWPLERVAALRKMLGDRARAKSEVGDRLVNGGAIA